MTIFTNLLAFSSVSRLGVDVKVVYYERPASLRQRWHSIRRAMGSDYIVINCSPRDHFAFALAKTVWPFAKARIVSMDTVLSVPRRESLSARTALLAKIFLFRRVHLFVEYFRDTLGYETHYGIPREKFRYIPFKINRFERVLTTHTFDGGYVFCGGNTRRDFKTLIDAVRDLPYPVRLVTMDERTIIGHGSSLDEHLLPSNVEVVRHDGSDTFLDYIAGAKLVALPIKRENISASGIGVYLASMALGKCVVISQGPAVDQVVPDGAAVVVPPEDALALRAAIVRAYTDDVFRNTVAAAGRTYARSLGGEERLCQSLLEVLRADYLNRAGNLGGRLV